MGVLWIIYFASVTLAWREADGLISSSSSSRHAPTTTTRARFLSSSTASAFVAAVGFGFGVLGQNPDECAAASDMTRDFSKNPRYIDRELEMKVGENPGKSPRTRGVLVRR